MSDGLPIELLHDLREGGITYGIRRCPSEDAYEVTASDGEHHGIALVSGDALWAATKSKLASKSALHALVLSAGLNARVALEKAKPLRERFR